MIAIALAIQLSTQPVRPVSRLPLRSQAAAQSIDFANMPIEDAIMLAYMLISDDARQDMREQMEEMKKVAVRRKEAREMITKMAVERARIDGNVRAYLEARGNARSFPSYADWLKSQKITMPKVQIDSTSGQAELTKPGDFVAPEAPPAETDTRPCVDRADEDECVIRAMQARLHWLRRRPAR